MNLAEQLELALEIEDYEKAAKLRDKIELAKGEKQKLLKNKKSAKNPKKPRDDDPKEDDKWNF